MTVFFPWNARAQAFSLIETALALGVASFVGVAILGLFSVGLNLQRDSRQELEAIQIAHNLVSLRRAAPQASNLSAYSLPALTQSAEASIATTPVYLRADGSEAASRAEAAYALGYRITPGMDLRASDVYLCLYWPAGASSNSKSGSYELWTSIPLE